MQTEASRARKGEDWEAGSEVGSADGISVTLSAAG